MLGNSKILMMGSYFKNSLIVLLCLPFVFCGCPKKSGENQTISSTKYYLNLWGENIIYSFNLGLPIYKQKTIEEALTLLKNNSIIEKSEYPFFQCDAWGNKYRWICDYKPGGFVIKVISDGRDGLFQNCKGDDLFIIVEKKYNGEFIISAN
jgi:hypothetical protein